MLKTPEKIRNLQRKLYQKAKQEKECRFYLLYDKVYRMDILSHAYSRVRANRGASGVDQVTFESIETMEEGAEGYLKRLAAELFAKRYKPMPVRRVYIPKADGNKRPLGIPTVKDRIVQMAVKIVIEPIFEADFCANSYGFRPNKNAHQAMDDISFQLRKGKTQVIDADIARYFDTILHNKLLNLVSERIVDNHILRLIKMWLKAPVVEEREDGKKKYIGNSKGTPQGGVISPLLANIYLNVLDTTWKLKKVQERYGARLVRFADDCVALCSGNPQRVLGGIKTVLEDLGLSLNEDKTKVVDAKNDSFDFLGFTTRLAKSSKTGRKYPLIRPSKKAIKHIRAEIKGLTMRRNLSLPKDVVLYKLNEVVRGWTGYFYYQNCSKDLSALKNYLEERVRIYLRRKKADRHRGYKAYPCGYLYNVLGLYKIPTTAPWTQTAKAFGRR
ncbi:MAG: group II intron reverse transcriptase/maturase [Candidatus Scalindua rubra]|uniref:Strong similarity to group II intron-encoded protein LtrA n=1 Tax=Candidatus Scalindua brodae TaxID=237368 RepID=A0A0B0EKI0_9BACT|nr:MAG: strong similarity to group II intron-encoded protein LtrA [Candidatus Scalindua brodae]MBZ0109696.1 group II intron reverse transcriptase/maturase [Candidatus Scalindua rubra]